MAENGLVSSLNAMLQKNFSEGNEDKPAWEIRNQEGRLHSTTNLEDDHKDTLSTFFKHLLTIENSAWEGA